MDPALRGGGVAFTYSCCFASSCSLRQLGPPSTSQENLDQSVNGSIGCLLGRRRCTMWLTGSMLLMSTTRGRSRTPVYFWVHTVTSALQRRDLLSLAEVKCIMGYLTTPATSDADLVKWAEQIHFREINEFGDFLVCSVGHSQGACWEMSGWMFWKRRGNQKKKKKNSPWVSLSSSCHHH